MLKFARSGTSLHHIDLATVRETLMYMMDDMSRFPELARAQAALDTAITELGRVESTQTEPASQGRIGSRFFAALPR